MFKLTLTPSITARHIAGDIGEITMTFATYEAAEDMAQKFCEVKFSNDSVSYRMLNATIQETN